MEISQLCGEIPVHLCFNWKFTQMWQLETWFVYFYTLEWSDGQLFTDYWSFSVSELICIPGKSGQSCFATNLHVSKCAPLWVWSSILSPACNVSLQHKGYKSKYKFWLYFSTKGTNWGPKAVISTCSQVVSITLSGELSNSSGTLLLYSAEGTKIAFQEYLLLEYVGGPEKDQVFVAGQEISMFSLHIFFLLIVCLLA